MKVFIYDKRTSKLKRVITNVVEAKEAGDKIIYRTNDDEEFHVPMKLFKSTAFQN